MKTSIDLPDDLYRQVKSKSALQGRAVREVATDLFSAWVADRPNADSGSAGALVAQDGTRQEWLDTFAKLAAAVSDATADQPGIVQQLQADRR